MPDYFCEWELTTESPVQVESGDVLLTIGKPFITVHRLSADPRTNKTAKLICDAWAQAQHFLDELSFVHGISLRVEENESITYGSMPPGKRHAEHTVRGQVLGANTIVIESLRTTPNEAKGFFRLAELAEDPIDSYRYYFLAIEYATSLILERKKGQSHKVWLKKGLNSCWGNEELMRSDLQSAGVRPPAAGVAEWVADTLWNKGRLPSFHAKSQETHFGPFGQESETEPPPSDLARFIARRAILKAESLRPPQNADRPRLQAQSAVVQRDRSAAAGLHNATPQVQAN